MLVRWWLLLAERNFRPNSEAQRFGLDDRNVLKAVIVEAVMRRAFSTPSRR
jgi:hypothetical protein